MANGVGSAAGRSKRDQMPKQIRLNAFDMNCVGHQSPGLWTHPRDRADRYNTLDYWVELAKLLEVPKPEKDEEPDPAAVDARVLTRQKSNWAKPGEKIEMRWKDGVFEHTPAPCGILGSIER